MPGYTNYKKRNYKKKPYKRYGGVNVKTAYNIAKRVVNSGKPRREIRFTYSKVMSTSVVANSFLTSDITIISQGDTLNSRSGNMIYLSGVKVNFNVNNPYTQPRMIRLMVVKDINRNSDILDISTWTNLFTGQTFADQVANGSNTDIVASLNTGVVKVFYDKIFYLATNSECSKHVSAYIPIKQRVMYSNLGSTSTDVDSGSIYVIAHLCESSGTPSATSVDLDGMLRVFFSDI